VIATPKKEFKKKTSHVRFYSWACVGPVSATNSRLSAQYWL